MFSTDDKEALSARDSVAKLDEVIRLPDIILAQTRNTKA